MASHHQTFTTRTNLKPTHKIVAKTNPAAEQGIAFYAYSVEEMTAVRNGMSLAAQLFGMGVYIEVFEAEKPH